MEYLWKISGADLWIIRKSGSISKNGFALIGGLYLLINILTFFAFFGLINGVFNSIVIGVFGAGLITFLISNIYRLTLISLEPQTLPVKEEKGSLFFAYAIRYLVVSIFAFFVAKSLETTLFGFKVDEIVVNKHNYSIQTASKGLRFEESKLFLDHMIELNRVYPVVWLMTILIIGIFLTPVIVRFRLRSKMQYYSIKEKVDIKMVKEHYLETTLILERIYRNTYAAYNDEAILFNVHEPKYSDPPFNTKPILSGRNCSGTMKDFANLNWD
jgi:hypothetical protein